MPLPVTKDCFPDPSICHNCLRKRSIHVKKHSNDKKNFKRCGNCHLMTYCDKDCQREHWIKVHKSHCRFLSGKTPVKNSKHNVATCVRCINRNQASPTQLRSDNSPTTICNIEEVIMAMKTALGGAFNFHGEGKKCSCSVNYACQLPFQLGEVSGQYLEAPSTGIDIMMAHSLSILTAMTIKASGIDQRRALHQMYLSIIRERSYLWYDILVRGMPVYSNRKDLWDQVISLGHIYGASNPWWKALKFSVEFALQTAQKLVGNYKDACSLEDPRFENIKLIYDYDQSQLRNQATVTEKKMWPALMLWPKLVNGSLSIVLPPGIQCQICFTELSGDVEIQPKEVVFSKSLPSLFPEIGDCGVLMACCPVTKSSNCRRDCLLKNERYEMESDENQLKERKREVERFLIEARDCDFCFKSSLSSHRCSACLTVQYCSTTCQKKDMEFHKSVCETWDKDKSRKILGKGKQKEHWKSVYGHQ